MLFLARNLFFWTPVHRSQHKNVVFLVSGHGGDKQSWTISKKKWISGQKTSFLTRNSAFFYATPMKPPFLWLGRSRLNGMTTPPYPEVTLDTFGFPVGARLATRRAVLWPQLPKVALLGPKNAVFWPETSFFVVNLKIDCYNHDGTTKRQL